MQCQSSHIEIPEKRYFTIGEVSELCEVPTHVLRYWEQEFPDLKPARRRGRRRYYTKNEIEMVLDIIDLLYEKKFTISGARDQLKQVNGKNGKVADTSPPQAAAQQTIAELREVIEILN